MLWKGALIIFVVKCLFHPEIEASIDYCSTVLCNRTADYIISLMSPEADACKNFYEYACGGWMEQRPPADDWSDESVIKELNDQVAFDVWKEFEMVDDTDQKWSKAVRFTKLVYKHCLNVNDSTENDSWTLAVDAYRHVFKHLKDDFTWQNQLPFLPVRASVSPLFKFVYTKYVGDHSKRILFIFPPKFIILEHILRNPEKHQTELDVYKQFFKDILVGTCQSLDQWQTEMDCTDFVPNIASVIKFEIELYKILSSQPPITQNDYKKIITLKDLQDTSHFDWKNVISRLFSLVGSQRTVDDNFELSALGKDYIYGATELLKKTNSQTILTYFFLMFLEEYGESISEHYRLLKAKLQQDITGHGTIVSRDTFCSSFVQNIFSSALSSLYVKEYFDKTDKKIVETLIDKVRGSFENTIKTSWNIFDEESKLHGVEKINNIQLNVGYPEHLLNNDMLDQEYHLTDDIFNNDCNFIILLLDMFAQQNAPTFQENDSLFPEIKRRWPSPVTSVKVEYVMELNSLAVSAAIMRLPFYDAGQVPAVLYGGIGTFLGHEITHSCDSNGSYFDSNGLDANWWTDETRQKYNEHTQCFINKYSSIIEPKTGLNINGERTLGENIADYSAVKQAYCALNNHEISTGVRLRLAKLPDLTTAKLFFIVFAQNFCQTMGDYKIRHYIENGYSSLPKYRVELPLNDYERFNAVFGCGNYDPNSACSIW